MAERHPKIDPLDQSASKAENPLWGRLRESMERLRTADEQTTADALAQKLAARASLLRGRLSAPGTEQAPLVFVALNKGREQYGIPVDDVLEVQALDHFTVVPKTPPFLPGVVHWRGTVLSLLDLGKLFGVPQTGLNDVHVYVVVEAGGRRVGIVAREVEDVFSIPRSQLATAPPLSGNVEPDWIAGIHDHQRLILRMELILQEPRLIDWIEEP